MTDQLLQERGLWNITHPSPGGVFAPKQATPLYPYRSGMEPIGGRETLLFIPQILVVDDSPTIRRIMEVCHTRAGFSLQSFADGVEALRWLRQHPFVIPSLIYLDICLPHMDGYDVARILHSWSYLAAVPVVLLSGRDGMLDRLKGRLVGAKGYITKPFRSEDILSHTRHYLSRGNSSSLK